MKIDKLSREFYAIDVAVCALRARSGRQRVHVLLYEPGGVAGGALHDAPERREAEDVLFRNARDVDLRGVGGGGGLFSRGDDSFRDGETDFFWHVFLLFGAGGKWHSMLCFFWALDRRLQARAYK